jgi:hypothetical protein
MRALLAACLAAFLAASALAPHVHSAERGDHDCAACLARNVESARSEVPDLAPTRVHLVGAVAELVGIPAVGAPLGAVPGQSPPVNG